MRTSRQQADRGAQTQTASEGIRTRRIRVGVRASVLLVVFRRRGCPQVPLGSSAHSYSTLRPPPTEMLAPRRQLVVGVATTVDSRNGSATDGSSCSPRNTALAGASACRCLENEPFLSGQLVNGCGKLRFYGGYIT